MDNKVLETASYRIARWSDKLSSIAGVGKRNNTKRVVFWLLTIGVVFSVVFLLNILTPMTSDDFGYLFVYAEEGVRVGSISDIIRSQYNHYLLWGGRSVVHFIAQALLMLHPIVIDFLNSLVYMLYVFLLYHLIKGKGQHSISLFILINLSVWFIQPAFGDTILWITGSANYLWGTSLILLFLLPFRMYSGMVPVGSRGVFYAFLFFIYGILAGWSNENTAGAMILTSVIFLIYYRKQGWKLPMWLLAGILGAVIGYLVMILAPGNAIRAGEAGELGIFIIVYRLLMHSLTLFTEYGVWLLTYSVVFVIYWRFGANRVKKKRTVFMSSIFLLATLVSIYVMIFSPSFPPRAWFGALSYLLVALGIIYYNLNFGESFISQLRTSVLLIASVAFFFSFYLAMRDVTKFYSISKEREMQVGTAIKKGLRTCEFERYIAATKFVHTEDELSNHLMSGYYRLDITFKETLRK